MRHAMIAGAVAAVCCAATANAAVTPADGGASSGQSAETSAMRMAQGAGVNLPPEQRCPQQPPSEQRIQNPYVIWICSKPGGTQFDYYLGTRYLFSVVAGN